MHSHDIDARPFHPSCMHARCPRFGLYGCNAYSPETTGLQMLAAADLQPVSSFYCLYHDSFGVCSRTTGRIQKLLEPRKVNKWPRVIGCLVRGFVSAAYVQSSMCVLQHKCCGAVKNSIRFTMSLRLTRPR